METVEIEGIKYRVVRAVTPGMADAAGNTEIAKRMERFKISHHMYLARLRGKRIYMTTRHENGSYGTVTRIPGSTASDI